MTEKCRYLLFVAGYFESVRCEVRVTVEAIETKFYHFVLGYEDEILKLYLKVFFRDYFYEVSFFLSSLKAAAGRLELSVASVTSVAKK